MTTATLDQVLDALEHARQRATYGAVAKFLGKTPRTLMRGRQRDQHHSWVVNRTSGKATGYEDHELHPELQTHDHIIDDSTELAALLAGTESLQPVA